MKINGLGFSPKYENFLTKYSKFCPTFACRLE